MRHSKYNKQVHSCLAKLHRNCHVELNEGRFGTAKWALNNCTHYECEIRLRFAMRACVWVQWVHLHRLF